MDEEEQQSATYNMNILLALLIGWERSWRGGDYYCRFPEDRFSVYRLRMTSLYKQDLWSYKFTEKVLDSPFINLTKGVINNKRINFTLSFKGRDRVTSNKLVFKYRVEDFSSYEAMRDTFFLELARSYHNYLLNS